MVSANSRLQAIQIIAQRKSFYRQRIPEFSCARKETVDVDILVTSRNGDRKIMQSIRITSRPPSNYCKAKLKQSESKKKIMKNQQKFVSENPDAQGFFIAFHSKVIYTL